MITHDYSWILNFSPTNNRNFRATGLGVFVGAPPQTPPTLTLLVEKIMKNAIALQIIHPLVLRNESDYDSVSDIIYFESAKRRLMMPTSYLRTKLILMITLIILGLSLTPAWAKEPAQAITMDAEAAFQGIFKYGEWLPIWVNLENAGSDLEAEIQVKITRDFEQITYSVPVSLANGARKRIPVYVLPNNFTHELKVDLVIGDEVVQSQKIKVQPQPNINYLIGVAAPERGALALLPGIRLPGGRLPVMMDISAATLPDRSAGLRSLDTLILNNIDTSSLSPKQISALIDWVRQGGRLVISGGVDAFQITSGLPDELLPIKITDINEVQGLDSLAAFANAAAIRVPGPFVMASGDETQGQTLAEQNGLPLVQEIALGDGFITFVALDLSVSPFDAWTGTTAFWETIITPGAAYPNWMPPDMSLKQLSAGPMSNALSTLPSLDLPSARNVALLLGIYIMVIGPVNYWVLRWRKKLHWAWVSIPLITVIFTGLSFGIAYARRGTDIIVNKIAIIQGQDGDSAQVSSYIGLFSPANQSYEIEVSGENLLSPVSGYYDPWSGGGTGSGNLTFVQSNPSLVRGLTVNQWSMQSFMTETKMEDIGELIADLYLQDGYLTGTITNETGYPLQDITVILRPNYARLGDLAAGDSVEVKLELDSLQNMMYGPSISWQIYEDQTRLSGVGPPPRALEFKRMVLEAAVDQQSYYGTFSTPGQTRSAKELDNTPAVTLLGWLEAAPPEVRINGEKPQESANALYITEVDYQYPEHGAISIPAGLIPGLLAEMPLSGGTCGVGSTSVWLDQGEAVFEYILPPEISDIQVDSLKLALQTDSGFGNTHQIEFYDWENAEWQIFKTTFLGLNTISEPGNFISPEKSHPGPVDPKEPEFSGGWLFLCHPGIGGKSQMNAVETIALTRQYGKLTAVNALNLQVAPGSLFGLIGPNGAGKTTTLRMLAGLLDPTSGEIRINGHSTSDGWHEVRRQIGYMPDFFGVYEDMLVWEYLDFFARCYDIPSQRRGPMIEELLNLVDLTEKRAAYVQSLSRGMRQRLCLAHALVHDPAVLLLDEPASGLDPRARVEMRELLRELGAMGKTIIVSSHILSELAEMCDAIGIIERGELVACGPVEEISRQAWQGHTLRIKTLSPDSEAVEALLRDQPGVGNIFAANDALEVEFTGDDEATAALLEILIAEGIRVTSFSEISSDLEEIFLSLTKGEVA